MTVLIAEDDDDDYLLTKKAFQDVRFAGSIHRVKDGEELMDFFLERRLVERLQGSGTILLLLLDLNMPRKDGREALKEIKAHPELKKIPVVVLTTSTAEPDITLTYALGANSFIRKPSSYQEFVACVKTLLEYWIEVAELPQIREEQRTL